MPAPTPPQSQAGAAAGGGGITSEGQRVASPSPAPVPTNGSVNSSSSSTTGSSTGSSTAVGPLAAAAASASARKASASMSTLNPNAGGFQPGALSSLGEVDNEHLITPMASNFDLNAHQQMPQPHHYQQQHSANSGNPLNVFGSPLSTPQHQTGAAHYANPQDWQNYHNVFNAGIGNPTGAGGSPSSSASATDSAINPQLAAFAAAMGVGVGPAGIGGSFDFTNNANLAAMMAIANGFSAGGNVNSNTGNGSNAQMQNQLAALQALQQQQQIAAALGGGGGGGPGSAQTAIPFQQFGSPSQQQQQQQQLFNLQQQQLQLQALLAAQMQAQTQVQQPYASHQGPSTPNSRENANVPPRFVQSGSQPDLASMLAGNTGLGNTASPGGAAGGFMAEQLALQAQYEALRQQQNELLKRFSEMQLQAQQLAMAQASQQQQQQQGSSPGVMSPQSQAGTIQGAGNQHVSAPAPASQSPSVSRQQAPHRRGPSQSISGIGSNNPASAAFTSGPMGQFGSMGQFTLPSQSSTNSPGAAQSQAPKGHGRRHSVNVTKRDPNLNTSFSFPNALGGSLGSASPAGGMSADNSFAINTSAIQEANENASTEAAQVLVGRAHGHGRRESRGSIGSLAGWGTSRSRAKGTHLGCISLAQWADFCSFSICQTPTLSRSRPCQSLRRTSLISRKLKLSSSSCHSSGLLPDTPGYPPSGCSSFSRPRPAVISSSGRACLPRTCLLHRYLPYFRRASSLSELSGLTSVTVRTRTLQQMSSMPTCSVSPSLGKAQPFVHDLACPIAAPGAHRIDLWTFISQFAAPRTGTELWKVTWWR